MDLDTAYHRIHANTQISSTFITFVNKLALLYLRLTSSATSIPEDYTTVHKATIYLLNDLLMENSWDATEIQSPHRHLLKEEIYKPGSYPLVQLDALEFDIEAKEASMD